MSILSCLKASANGRDFLTTAEAAHALNRKEQTMRKWAMKNYSSAPIKPVNVNGRLMWRVEDIAKLLGVTFNG